MLITKDEKKIAVFRRHWIVMFFEMMVFAFIGIVPVIAIPIAISIVGVEIIPQMQRLFFVLTAIWILFVWIAFFVVYTNYYLDVWIITNKRLIDVEQKGLFTREISTVRIENIQDAVSNIKGFVQTMFNYGEVHVQTSGAEREFVIYDVHDPKRVKDQIMRIQEHISQEKRNVHIVSRNEPDAPITADYDHLQ